MLAGWLGTLGVLLAAGAAGTELLALRAGDGQTEREAQMADLAEEFATTAETVLRQVEARTGALEALVRQLLAVQPQPQPVRPAPTAKARPRSRPVPAPSPLVSKVTELARAGCTVPEIARRLGLSRGAVEVALRLSEQSAAKEVQ